MARLIPTLGAFRRFFGKGHSAPLLARNNKPKIPTTPKRVVKQSLGKSPLASPTSANGLVSQLKSNGRYAMLLMPKVVGNVSHHQLRTLTQLLDQEMSLIESGPVRLERGYLDQKPSPLDVVVEAFFIDRFAVTNGEFQKFVDQDGYRTADLWESEAYSVREHFVDLSGEYGPSGWKGGRYPVDAEMHPVVGVSWYEAQAFARWVGKRLPTNAEWTKAAAWPSAQSGKVVEQRVFPWGADFDVSRANVGSTGLLRTVAVDEFQNGNSASDVCQLSGNVWEWTADEFLLHSGKQMVASLHGAKSLRGGAFDTYFESQASCKFESADNPLQRRANIGFRCVVTVSQFAKNAQDAIIQSGIESGPVSFDPDASVAPSSGGKDALASSRKEMTRLKDTTEKKANPKRSVNQDESTDTEKRKPKSRFAGPGEL